ncbi:MAG: hypothetical protein FWC29_00090 [Methanomassiliicoccaceae archaeon]|nr:hypothetical protein [Methanomassiliicoccaceae archaeon]
MSPSFDDHLEAILQDCNDRVNQLEESGGSDEEMLDALINRGSVLSMMEYYTAALSDFDDAVDIIVRTEKAGKAVDPGCFVRSFVSRGELVADKDQTAEDYVVASTRLRELNDNSKFCDRKKTVWICLDCGRDLIYSGHPEGAVPFADKLYEMLTGKDDSWSRNRYMETLSMSAKSMEDMGMDGEALEYYTEAIRVGHSLLEKSSLEDMEGLIFALVLRGNLEKKKGLMEPYFADRKTAISLFEELLFHNRLDDTSMLVTLHQDMASTYLSLNKVKEAEEHLMKEVALSMDGAEEYIREFIKKD